MACVNVEVDPDEFSDRELISELKSRGYEVVKTGSTCNYSAIEGGDLERIEHLFVCGQKSQAVHELLSKASRVIGRDLTH